jgi:glycosyltransferase involved in cell wall biosynthesis
VLTIHERLQAQGHESTVIDLTPYHRVKPPGVHYPHSTFALARLLLDTPADVVHVHIGALTLPKVALAAIVNRLPGSKKICTLHLGGRFYPKKGFRASGWGATAMVLRQFDTLIAINREIAAFFERLGVQSNRVHLIGSFSRLRNAESVRLSNEIEAFCRQHRPLIASVDEFEPGADLSKQFDILNKVRERYPSAGLIAVGNGSLHFTYLYARAAHQDCNHIELTGSLPEAAAREVMQRATVVLHRGDSGGDLLALQEALNGSTPVATNDGPRRGATYLSAQGDVGTASREVLRSLQIAHPQHEDAPAALTDGVDDVIRLYRQLTGKQDESAHLQAIGYEWPSMG